MAKLKILKPVFTVELTNENDEVVDVIKIDKTDKSIEEIYNVSVKLGEEAKKLDNLETFDEIVDVIKRNVDSLLGEGSFEKINNLTGSVAYTLDYFVVIANMLVDDLKEANTEKLKNKYL